MPKTALTACLVACLAAAPAGAQQTPGIAPPGASAIDEYVESIPTDSGDKPARTVDSGAGGGGALTPKQQAALARLGPDGQQAAALADAVGPAAKPSGTGGTSETGGGPAAAAKTFDAKSLDAPAGDGGFGGTLARAVGGSGGGLGAALPILLAVSLLAAIGLGLRRRRLTA